MRAPPFDRPRSRIPQGARGPEAVAGSEQDGDAHGGGGPRRPPPRPLLLSHAVLGLALAACTGCGDPSPAGGPAFPESWRYRDTPPPVTATSGMVVSTDELASQVGVDVLRSGGNAMDAAVAVMFALAVVNPEAGNLGGDGFLVLRTADGETAALDFRARAPFASTRDMYLDDDGEVTDDVVVGHLSVGVPGTVDGMWEVHRRFGRLEWATLLDPAIELAGGFPVRPRFLNSLGDAMVAALQAFPASAEQFLPRGGQPPAVGDTLRQPDLARTLRRLRDLGRDDFYRGETADLILAEMERGGGILTRRDLAEYRAVWREPVAFEYRGHTVISMPPPSSGGVTMAQTAGILERHDLASLGWQSAQTIHLHAEAWRRGYADRNHYLADPDFVEMPLERLTSAAYATERGATISLDAATPSFEVGPGLEGAPAATGTSPNATVPEEGENTTHYSIVDADGNAVSVTTTVNSWYGSKVTVTGAGFILNNDMDDLAARPGSANQFGLVQGENNAIEPGKRMLSSMSPTIVLGPDGELGMVTGTPGGATIITTVFQTISNVVDFGMNVVEAVQAPRVHHQHLPDQIFYEAGALPPETVSRLETLGHVVVERGGLSGDVQMIVVVDDLLTAWSDPRRGGRALGY